ncbi:short-chain dehydrogenase [Staphylococcus equorum]|uniref:GolD/DthD family dehydrogenase n=1 Tax=Staphylococcus equorum TaxID=246432 RepID=UPI00085383F3|nr:D-threitol dehydrogenase [Staphylococcus equorum]OEK81175.1 short-chain dehydrogenase [Staphylococcus equorum]
MQNYKGFDKDFNITDKVAIITGGNSGIGKAISDFYIEKGAKVAVLDIKDSVNELKGDHILGIQCDITNEQDIDNAIELTKRTFDRIDILVNSAGVALLDKAETMSSEIWQKQIDLNLTASFKMAQKVGNEFIEQGEGGKIINMASQNALIALVKHTAYGVTKAGIVNLTKSLAFEWAKFNINVNAIAPTIVATELSDKAWVGKAREDALAGIPLGRFGEPEEVAAIALFLASDATNFMTGETIVLDGGNTIK